VAKRDLGIAVGYGISLVGSVLSLVLYAHVLGPDDYGRLAVDLAMVEALQGVVFQWHRLAVVRFWAAAESSDLPSYLNTYNWAWFGLTALVLIVSGAVASILYKSFEFDWLLVIALGLAKSGALYAQELARASGASFRYTAGALFLTIGSTITGIAAYKWTHSVGAVLTASMAVFAGSSVICIRRAGGAQGKGSFSQIHFRKMLNYGLPLVPVFLAAAALTRFDRPVLALFESSGVVGVYAAATALVTNLVSAVCLLVVTPAYPWLLREKERRAVDDYQCVHARIGLLMLTGVLAASVALYCGRGILLPLLLGKEIGVAAVPYVAALLLISIINAFKLHFFDQAYHLFSRTKGLMFNNIATLVLATCAIYFGSEIDGLIGLLYGLLIANSVSLAISIIFARSFVNVKYISSGVAVLVPICVVSVLTGEMAVRVSPALDPQAAAVVAAAAATLTFVAGIYAMNIGAIRSVIWRRI
jgi:O-antigen/teichoic acid export membrane protein